MFDRLHRRPHHDHAAARAGDGAAYEQQVFGRAHFDDLDVLRRDSFVAFLPRQALVLEPPAGKGAIADRAAVAEVLVCAVAGGKPAEAVPLHYAGVAAPLGDAGDVDFVALLKQPVDGNLVARRQRVAVAFDAKLAQHLKHALAGLYAMLPIRLGRTLRLLAAETELHAGVAVGGGGLRLHDRARPGLDHGDRHQLTGGRVHLPHAQLLAAQSPCHVGLVLTPLSAPSPRPPPSLQLAPDVDAGGEIELAERVDRLLRRIENVEQALVGADLELLPRFLVDVWRAVDGKA